MGSFNQLIMLGRLTRNPETTFLPSGLNVVNFGLATNRKRKTEAGEEIEETTFLDCRAFGKLASLIEVNFDKGRPILVSGRLCQDRWTAAADGSARSKHYMLVEALTFVDSGQDEGPGRQV